METASGSAAGVESLPMQVHVSDDGTEAQVLSVSPEWGDGRPVGVPQLKKALSEQGIMAGLCEDALRSLADILSRGGGYSGKPVVVARAVPPGPGRDGKLVLSPPTEADLSKNRISWLAFPGEKIATIVPPAVGEPGMTVRGEKIPGQLGKTVSVRLGKGVETGQSGQDVVASVAGFVQFDWKSISVVSPVSVSRDKMTACLTVVAPEKVLGTLTTEDYCKLLRVSGVVHGINKDWVAKAVKQAAETREDCENIMAAQGTEPQRGQDARTEYRFSNEVRPGLLLPDGKMDYRERDLIQNVTVGQELAVKIPATQGKPGTTVTGDTVAPKPGKDKPLRALDNVELSPDGLTLVAKREGMAMLDKSGGVRVITEFVIRGDVDYASGNVRCKGGMKIEGSVLPAFNVHSEQDLIVEGGIDSANVSADGSIFVGHGIQGSPETRIVAGAEVRALYIENATVRAKGDIVLGQSVRHSDMRTSGVVKVTERKGTIVGGKVFATHGIVANEVGSELGTRTELVVGVDTSKLDQFEALEKKLDECERRLRRLDAQLGPVVEESKKMELHAGKKNWLAKLLKQRAEVVAERDEAIEARAQVASEMRSDLSAQVRVLRKVNPGVVVRIGEATYSVGDTKYDVSFMYDDGTGEVVCREGKTATA